MINAIDFYNRVYNNYLQNQNDPVAANQMKPAADYMLSKVKDVTDYICCHSTNNKDDASSSPKYAEILKKRQKLLQDTDMVMSMKGAPKDYNEGANIYDEYRISYQSAMYIYILVTILAVFVIYMYFKAI